MARFSWLHFTDLHFGMSEQAAHWPTVREDLVRDLERLHSKSGPWDAIVFSGDLTQTGSPADFAALDVALGELWNIFARLGSRPTLLPVPGNHDLVRPKATGAAVKALRGWSSDPTIQQAFWQDRDSEYRKTVIDAFAPYDAWLARWRTDHPSELVTEWTTGLLPGEFSATLAKQGDRIGVVGLNSAYLQLAGGDYTGALELDVQQLHGACGGDAVHWIDGRRATLLLTHHPPEWLHPAAQANFKANIAPNDRFALHLFGHMHEPKTQSVRIGGLAAQRWLQGASLFSLETWGDGLTKRIHGYSAGSIDMGSETAKLSVWPRIMAPNAGGGNNLRPDFDFGIDYDAHCWTETFPLRRPVSDRSSLASISPPPLPDPRPPGAPYLCSWYVRRKIQETMALSHFRSFGSAVALWGPEQYGKTTLLRFLLAELAKGQDAAPQTVVQVDLGGPGATILDSPGALLLDLAHRLAQSVADPAAADAMVAAAWRRPNTLVGQLSSLLQDSVLPRIPGRLVLVIERAHNLYAKDGEADFFGALRAWSEAAQTELATPWAKLRIVVLTSWLPHSQVTCAATSEFFNRALPVVLDEFSVEQAGALATLYQLRWTPDTLERLMRIVGGHPYLLGLVMFAASAGTSEAHLLNVNYLADQLCLAHLQNLWLRLGKNGVIPGLAVLLATGAAKIPDQEYQHLRAMGVIKRGAGDGLDIRNELYRIYLSRRCREYTAVGQPL